MKSHEYYALQQLRHGVAHTPWKKYAEWIILHDPAFLAAAPSNVLQALTPRQAFSIVLRKGSSFSQLDSVGRAFKGTRADLIQCLQSLWNAPTPRQITPDMLATVPSQWLYDADNSRLLLAWLIFQDFSNGAYRTLYRNVPSFAPHVDVDSVGGDVRKTTAHVTPAWRQAVHACLLRHSGALLYGFVFVFYGTFVFFMTRVL